MPRAASSVLKATLIAMKHRHGEVDANLAHHRRWFDRAVADGAKFVGFPEFSLTGWVEDARLALPLESPAIREMASWTRKAKVWMATGLVERNGRTLHNTIAVFGPGGLIGHMRKINLIAREARVYQPGREFPVFNIAGCRMGVMTCADCSYPELFQLLSLQGAEVIFAPHANTLGVYGNNALGWRRWRMESWPQRAKDSCIAIMGINNAGLLEKPTAGDEANNFCSGGMALDWTGKPIAHAPVRGKRECMLNVEIDLAGLRAARKERYIPVGYTRGIIYPQLTNLS